MEDHEDDDADEELEFLPRLHVFVRPQEEKSGSSQERNRNNSQKRLLHLKIEKNMKMMCYQMQIQEEILKTDMDYS